MANKIDLTSLEQLEVEYRGLTAIADTFCTEVSRQLSRVLTDAGVTLGFPIEFRVKTWASIAEKLERKAIQLERLSDLNDLAGLRIILLFRRDVEVTCAALEQHFDVIDRYDTQERLREDQFGYSSRHFIVRLPKLWLSIPTRVSALLETVDLELERVLNEREEYRATLAVTSVEKIVGDTEAALDVDLLQRLLAENFPADNKRGTENYGELLQDLSQVGIHTSGQLQELIAKYYATVAEEEQSVVQGNREKLEKGEAISGTTEDRVRRGVFFTHVGLARRILAHAGLEPTRESVTRKRKRTKKVATHADFPDRRTR